MSSDVPIRPGEPFDPPTPPEVIRPEPLPSVPGDTLTPAQRDAEGEPLPVVYPVPAEPARPGAAPLLLQPPHPGLGFAALWSVAFLMVTYGALIAVLIVALLVQAVMAGDIQAYLQSLVEVEEAPDQPTADQSVKPPLKISPSLGQAIGVSILAAEVASVIFALLIIRLVVGAGWRRKLALYRPSVAQIVLTVLSLPAFLILPAGIHELVKKVLPSMMDENMQVMQEMFGQWPLWLGILAIGVGPGLGEELWCRGFLGRGLVARWGWTAGVLWTSLLFGLLHVDPAYAAVTAAMGLWLHFVYLTTRSLWASILLHTLNNSTAVVAARFAHDPALQAIDKPADQIPWQVYVAAALLLTAVGWALYRCRGRLVPASGGTGPAWHPAFPGAEYPPPDSGTVVARPLWPGWLASAAVILALAALVGVIWLAETGRLAGL
ncbi:MAG TPA: CPBP family intramembrane glutamic endopeptidase [Gemmataceae bacterium]|nr:CPBP family intramembrane glutamic endopeptidase [Gemmataceae bacterium]